MLFLLANLASSIIWVYPNETNYNINQNQGFQSEIGKTYYRLPPRANGKVPGIVYTLSHHSMGISLFFESNSDRIEIEYKTDCPYSFDMSTKYSTSGIDLYAYDSDGHVHICVGTASFGQTIVYSFEGLNRQTHEYRLLLPSADIIQYLKIGYSEGSYIRFYQTALERPIILYGTSITQGQGASRPGTAWANWLSRELEVPVYNYGYLGAGRLEPSVVDFVIEKDALVYVLDCLPNLLGEPADNVAKLTVAAYNQIRSKWPETPVVLIEHGGLTSITFNLNDEKRVKTANEGSKKAYQTLVDAGATNLYYITKEELGYTSDDIADIEHPMDTAMRKHMLTLSTLLRKVLNMEKRTMSTQIPVINMRNKGFRDRQHAIIDTIQKEKTIKKVILGDSITNFWGGRPDFPTKTGKESWDKYLEPEGFINLGISADRIENCLWRVYHDNFYGYKPEKIVSTIGTNNFVVDGIKNEEFSEGIRFLYSNIRQRQPQAQIIICGIFPRRGYEERIVTINKMIEKVCEEEKWKYIDPGLELLLPDGKIDESLFGDGLHPNAKGYDRLAPIVAAA